MAHYTKKKKKNNERKLTKENKSRAKNIMCLSVRHRAVNLCVTLKCV